MDIFVINYFKLATIYFSNNSSKCYLYTKVTFIRCVSGKYSVDFINFQTTDKIICWCRSGLQRTRSLALGICLHYLLLILIMSNSYACVAIILVKVNLQNLKITLSYLSFAFKRISCNRIFGIFELAIITLNEMHNYCTGCNAESWHFKDIS